MLCRIVGDQQEIMPQKNWSHLVAVP